jgi:hypothetical protein
MTRRKLDKAPISGVLEEKRRLPDGRRKITLRKSERQALRRQQRAEAAAALFLDLDNHRTWAEIAEVLEISPAQLKDLTKTPEFDTAYNMLFAEIGHDPRYRAAQGQIADMLPLAVRELKSLLTNPNTAAGVRLRAVKEILALNGLTEPQIAQSDRQELAKFLNEHEVNFQQNNAVIVPPGYMEKFAELNDVVEGQIVDTDTDPEGSDSSDPEAGSPTHS